MPGAGHADRQAPHQGRLVALIALTIGLALGAMAVPRLGAYLDVARWAAIVPDILGNRPAATDTSRLTGAQKDYCAAALDLAGDAILQQECARLTMRLADIAADGAVSEDLLAQAEAALRRAIADAPDRALPWSLLAAIEAERDVPPEEVFGLLRMSYLVGPHEVPSMSVRARVVLSKWHLMPDDLRAGAVRDLRGFWGAYRLKDDLVRIYLSSDFERRVIIRQHVLTSAGDARQFDSWVRKVAGVPPSKRPVPR